MAPSKKRLHERLTWARETLEDWKEVPIIGTDYLLDTERMEVRNGSEAVALPPPEGSDAEESVIYAAFVTTLALGGQVKQLYFKQKGLMEPALTEYYEQLASCLPEALKAVKGGKYGIGLLAADQEPESLPRGGALSGIEAMVEVSGPGLRVDRDRRTITDYAGGVHRYPDPSVLAFFQAMTASWGEYPTGQEYGLETALSMRLPVSEAMAHLRVRTRKALEAKVEGFARDFWETHRFATVRTGSDDYLLMDG